eukprot:678341-Rhodomonas_salina.1
MFRYVPDGHSMHASDPLRALNVPVPHAVQSPPSGPVYPALHTHPPADAVAEREADRLPAGHATHAVPASTFRYVPAVQSEHGADPFMSLYVPAPHAAHEPPSGPMYPALHKHPCTDVVLGRELEAAGHAKHDVPAITLRYVPSSQARHGVEPLTALKNPSLHALHADPSAPSNPLLHRQSVMVSLISAEDEL